MAVVTMTNWFAFLSKSPTWYIDTRNYIQGLASKQETIFWRTSTKRYKSYKKLYSGRRIQKRYMADVAAGTRLDKWASLVGRWEAIFLKHKRIYDNTQESFTNFICMSLVRRWETISLEHLTTIVT